MVNLKEKMTLKISTTEMSMEIAYDVYFIDF